MDQEYQNLFNGWEAQPPADMWQKIEVKLDGKDNKKPFFWWWFGAIALLIVLGIGAWFLRPNNVQEQQQTSIVEKGKNNSAKAEAETISNNTENTNKNVAVDKNLSRQNSADKKENFTVSKKETQAKATNANKPNYIVANASGNRTGTTPTTSNKTNEEDSSNPSKGLEQKETIVKEKRNNKMLPNTSGEEKVVASKTDSVSNKQAKEFPVSKDSVSASESLIATTLSQPINNQTEIKPAIKNTDSSVVKVSQADSISKPKIDSALLVKKDSVPTPKKTEILDSIKSPIVTVSAPKDSAKTKKAVAHILSLSIYGSPEIGNNVVNTNNTSFDIKSEKNNLQFAAGLRASFNFGSRIEISIAAAYSQASINYQSNQGLYFDRYTTQPYVFSSSYGDMSVSQATMLQGFSPLAPPSLTKFMLHGYQYAQTIQFLNIPINARFNITTGKLKTYAALGLNIQYALAEKAEVDLIKELETDVIKYNSLNATKLNYAPIVAIGAEYDFAKHFGVFLEPNARYNLIASSTNAAVKSNATFIGCAIGLRVNL